MMDIIPWQSLSRLDAFSAVPSAVTVGVFDGIHLGHRVVINSITETADRLLPVIITFSNNPQQVLNPTFHGKNLLTRDRKLEILGALGVKVAVMIDFSLEFSKMTATSFMRTLAAAFQVKKVVEGENFHFGQGREAGKKSLVGICAEIGASLETAETVYFNGLPVSSTRIRHAVQAGQMKDVCAMLSGAYPLDVPRVAITVTAEGMTAIDKHRLVQVTPTKGIFQCHTKSDCGEGEAEVLVEKERIFIRSNLPSIKTLYFDE